MLEPPMPKATTKHSKKLFHDAEGAGSSFTLSVVLLSTPGPLVSTII